MKTNKKFTKSNNRIISGVAAGLAEYLNWNPTLVRFLFLMLIFATKGAFILVYILLAISIPGKKRSFTSSFEQFTSNTGQRTGSSTKNKSDRKIIKDVEVTDNKK
ncbi:PspC domain-containing protein [Dellaglioa sp. BT-FLS60]